MTKFGTKLKKERLLQGLTIMQLAQKTGFSLGGISMWETGHRTPGAYQIFRLAYVLVVDIHDFYESIRDDYLAKHDDGRYQPRKPIRKPLSRQDKKWLQPIEEVEGMPGLYRIKRLPKIDRGLVFRAEDWEPPSPERGANNE